MIKLNEIRLMKFWFIILIKLSISFETFYIIVKLYVFIWELDDKLYIKKLKSLQ